MKLLPFRDETSRAFCSMVSQNLCDIDEHEWDSLISDDNFYNGYRWLRALEHSFGATEVIAVHGSAGLVAGCTVWEGDPTPGMFFLPDCMAGIPGPWQQTFLWLGGRRNTHNEVPCIQGRRRHQALTELGRCALDYALERGYAGFVMPYMPFQAAVELANAVGGVVILHSAEASLEVPESGLAGMMARSSAHDRNQIKSEIAAFRRMGSRVEWVAPGDLDDLLAADLITQNRRRHGNTQPREWMQRILAGQRKAGASHLGSAAISKRNDDMTALAIFYRFGTALHLRYFGADYRLDLNDYRYFVLCYYEPLDYAAANGLTKLRLSTSALRSKVNRGAKLEPQAIVAKCVNEEHICRPETSRHNRRLLMQYRDKFPRHLRGDWEVVESHQNAAN
ncbi:hypothetical protein XI00_06620 [Bradyrhizobium sp. CCBAU 21359]|uniref:GNAT family N-acetyltransferase n=1 Tax=Bradyrhizobium sp. CCBAU 21359 TaxID=1325080 RepID=UPI002305599E|nr:GNAT family N-acetyltransferase [Bradyrhizobium sp. CCBAU 21359]MDA9453928.1 hypothetical protein [Bradyrhizobium sp. CCBAU 21359]